MLQIMNCPDIMEIKVAGKYKIGRKIGHGSFGEIYLGTNCKTGEEVAVKLEKIRTRNPQLLSESRILKSLQGGSGIPLLHWFGAEGDFTIMVLELLGPSIEDLLKYCQNNFSLKTVLQLAEQMISRIEYLHSKDFIHRDIKPENFLIGLGSKFQEVFIIDFGLAKKFRDSKTGAHIPYCEGKNLTGTARYASISTHRGIQQSRRDDLECLGYVLIYMLKGSLPWQGLQGNSKREKYLNITQRKENTTLEAVCKDLPIEFLRFLQICRSLGFEERPDYGALKEMFSELYGRLGFSFDRIFDWTEERVPRDEPKVNELLRYRLKSPNRSIDFGFRNSSKHKSDDGNRNENGQWTPKLNLVVVNNK